jgi:hypothetical protein
MRLLTSSAWLAASLGSTSCDRPIPPADATAVRVRWGSELGDVVSAGAQTWFVINPARDSGWDWPLLCHLESRQLTCATIPGSAKYAAHLVEPGPATGPLVAIAHRNGTRYLEPFTWRTFGDVPGVAPSQPTVVRSDGSLWIEEDRNILIHSPTAVPRRLFSSSKEAVSLSAAGVLWIERRAELAFVVSASFDGDRLQAPRERRGIEPWGGSWRICRAGHTVGLIELHREDLVMFDLDGDETVRAHVGDSSVHCRPDLVAATTFTFASNGPPVYSCNAEGCSTEPIRSSIPFTLGAFALLEGGAFGVAGTIDDTLVTWKFDAVRELRPVNHRSLTMPRAASLPEGVLVVFLSGEVFVFDRAGNPHIIEARWVGLPLGQGT